jgi:hypothetical protein
MITNRFQASTLLATLVALLVAAFTVLLPASPVSAARGCPSGSRLIASVANGASRTPASVCISSPVLVGEKNSSLTVRGFTVDDSARDAFCTVAELRFQERSARGGALTVRQWGTKESDGCAGNHQGFAVRRTANPGASLFLAEVRVCVRSFGSSASQGTCSPWQALWW